MSAKQPPDPPAKLATTLFARDYFPHVLKFNDADVPNVVEAAERWAALDEGMRSHHSAFLSYLSLQQTYTLTVRSERLIRLLEALLHRVEDLPGDLRDQLLAAVAPADPKDAPSTPAPDPRDQAGEPDGAGDPGVEQADAPADVDPFEDEHTDDEDEHTDDEATTP